MFDLSFESASLCTWLNVKYRIVGWGSKYILQPVVCNQDSPEMFLNLDIRLQVQHDIETLTLQIHNSSAWRQKGLTCYCFKCIDRPFCLWTDELYVFLVCHLNGLSRQADQYFKPWWLNLRTFSSNGYHIIGYIKCSFSFQLTFCIPSFVPFSRDS